MPGLRLLQLDAKPLRGLRHLAGDRLRLALGLGAQGVRLLSGEALAALLAVTDVLNVRQQVVQRLPGLVGLLRRLLRGSISA